VAAAAQILLRRSHPFRQSPRDCHLPRKTGEENYAARLPIHHAITAPAMLPETISMTLCATV
jgi:hypothetical protein